MLGELNKKGQRVKVKMSKTKKKKGSKAYNVMKTVKEQKNATTKKDKDQKKKVEDENKD